MISRSSLAAVSVAIFGLSGAALAQQPLPLQPTQPPMQQQPLPAPQQEGTTAAQQQQMVTIQQAIDIARQHGLVDVRKVERDDKEWEVEGRDAQRREIEIEIDMRTGQVVDIDRG